jgi:hypothetical protein
MPVNFAVNTLTANKYVFLTLGGGLTLQKNDSVTLKELGDKVTLSNTHSFTFVDADVHVVNNTIAEAAHGMANGQPIELQTTGVLPAGLALKTIYYVVEQAAGTFKLSLTVGGAAINITAAAGGGTHTALKLAAKLKHSNFEIVRA